MTINTEKRRAGFEALAREHAHLGCLMQKADSFQEKFGATYHCPELEFAWQAYNAALDSVCVELPDTVANTGTVTSTAVLNYKHEVKEALAAAGIRYK